MPWIELVKSHMRVTDNLLAEPLISPAEQDAQEICLPLGLLGFEQNTRYGLFGREGEEPFVWLQMLEEPGLSFLLVPPFDIMPTYRPELRPEDVSFLGLSSPTDAVVWAIATVRGPRRTANLKGPIVMNRRTLRAKQIIPVNAANYQTDYPLLVASN